MFLDIGPLELAVLIILAVLIFGPEKLPKMIQDVASFIRKVKNFSDSARDDIRSELGPEFKDFEFEDLHPKKFAQKHLLDNDELGLKEIRNGFDVRKELAEVTDAVNIRETGSAPEPGGAPGGPSGGTPDLRKRDAPARTELPPFDSDAT
ncbi:sec-independent translocase [Streptomyces gobiensis]|uniref:sec-independent translocase n=1 Tax=Streptomyces gobiensis TaxID=2875706 RepID=UPI001E48D774|nr:sec-independent translocase [Streptomyces gobiensis]UGY93487.1 Sec-independent protein translocase subunit TatB [Streptomyces gobiensis]